MATLCGVLPAPIAVGAFDRLARSLRDGAAEHDGAGDGDSRTLAQLRADALADLLCDGDIAGTTPIGDGPDAATTYVPGVRAEVQLRDQTCSFPGCTRRASTSEADHTIEWRNGGDTALENLASLCTGHHHVRHGDRWTYVLHPDGTTDWTTPTGRRITTRPPGLAEPPPGPPPGPRFADPPPPF